MIVFPPAFSWKTHEKQSCLFGPQRIHEFLARDVECPRFLDAVEKKDTRTSSPQEKMWLDTPSLSEHVKSDRNVVAQKSCRWTPRLGIGLCSPSLKRCFVNRACAWCLTFAWALPKSVVLHNISFHIFLRPFPVFSQCFSQAWLRSNHDLKLVPQCVIEATGRSLELPEAT